MNESAKQLTLQLKKRFGNILDYAAGNEFSPIYSLAALFDPKEAHHVKFSPYDLKTLLSTCVERPSLERRDSSRSESSVIGGDDDSRQECLKNLLGSAAISSDVSPFTLAEKYLVAVYKSKVDALEFWKGASDQLV
jgi:hypothetical protein